MLFPHAPAMFTPAARIPVSGMVAVLRRYAHARRSPIQESIDSAFHAAAYAVATMAGERAARALQVGDVFAGCNPASVAFYGSDPHFAALPRRAAMEHKGFRAGFLAALPNVWTDAAGRIVLMRRAAPRTRANDRGGFVVLDQREPGVWRPVAAGTMGVDVFRSLERAREAARYKPAFDHTRGRPFSRPTPDHARIARGTGA